MFLFWTFLLWVNWENPVPPALRRKVVLAVSAILLIQSVETLRSGIWDINDIYSPGEAAAHDLTAYRNAHPGARIYAHGYKAFELQPWLPANPYANYHHGAGWPAYVTWRKGETWPTIPNLQNWQKLLAEKPDMIVASRVGRKAELYNLAPVAAQMGYRLDKAYPAGMIWRGAVVEDEALYIFERVK